VIRPLAGMSALAALLMFASAFANADPGAGTVVAPSTAVDVLGILREFGFPIFVAVWFMWRLEKRLDRYSEQSEKLYTVVTVLAKTIEQQAR